MLPLTSLVMPGTLQKYGVQPEHVKIKSFPESFTVSPEVEEKAVDTEEAENAVEAEEADLEDLEAAERAEDAAMGKQVQKKTKDAKFKAALLERLPPKHPLDTHFIELTSLLPPVPKRGDFDVNKIKQSLYFFS